MAFLLALTARPAIRQAATRAPSCSSTPRGSRSTSPTPTSASSTCAPRGYGDGHIPEAVWLDNNWIRNPKAPPTFLPTPQEFEALMAKLGISNTTRVIAYDERGGIYATRLWWILNYYGHSNVALLDGGWVKWAAEQRATDRDGSGVRRRDIQGQAGHGEGRDGRSGQGGDQQARR